MLGLVDSRLQSQFIFPTLFMFAGMLAVIISLQDPNTVLLSLHSPMMDQAAFMRQRQGLLESIERALARQGHVVVARIHGIHISDNQMQ